MAEELPGALLFACTENSVRSPMAAGIAKHLYGNRVFITSCGVKPSERDPFVTAVMDEIGIDLSRHRPQGFDDLEDSSFDIVISPDCPHTKREFDRYSYKRDKQTEEILPVVEDAWNHAIDALRYGCERLHRKGKLTPEGEGLIRPKLDYGLGYEDETESWKVA